MTRTGGGAFNLDLGGLKNLATNTWAEVIYDGSAWVPLGLRSTLMAVHIHEFLSRAGRRDRPNRPPGTRRSSAPASTILAREVRSERTLNMAQAREAGWDLPEIIAALNAELLVELDGTEITELKAKLEQADGTAAAAETARRDVK